MVSGAVPGSKGGYVMVRDAIKRAAPADLPYARGAARSAAPLRLPAEAPAAPEQNAPETASSGEGNE